MWVGSGLIIALVFGVWVYYMLPKNGQTSQNVQEKNRERSDAP
jgi:hypothetical protein